MAQPSSAACFPPTPWRSLTADEIRNYAPGRLEMLLKRTRSFWNSRRFLISTPGTKGDAMDTAYRAGDQRVWNFECPACGQLQPLKFEQLKWDSNDMTKPEGKWRFDALAETIRFECAGCGHRIKDTPVDRRWIENHGRFVPQNPNAPRSRVSYTWNALLPHWIEWRSIIEECLAAVDAMRVGGDIEPMFTFVTETLGEPWDLDRWMVTGDDYLLERKGDYDFGDPWPLEQTRFLAADRQARGGEHYFWVARAFGPGAASRLLAYGRCATTTDLEQIRQQLKVPLVNAMIDSGLKASEVYRFCMGAGWKAMKGDEAEWFLGQDPRTRKTVRRTWRRVLVDPNLGSRKSRAPRHLPLFQWSNPSIKDHLALFTHGVVGQWTIPKQTGRDYIEQMTAEVREEREDSRGRIKVLWIQKRRDNHYLDCELMIDAAAVISGGLKPAQLDDGQRSEGTA
ncbi:MAG TPA: phage terminase large subunit family protein [Verrucomicrobiota bacterium]|nr:phage terminase large subunit family protein [Verrucomicrobiota bacterium]